jgi:hypothetical protein
MFSRISAWTLLLICIAQSFAQCHTSTNPPLGAHHERNCSCTVPKIWLDIVVVLDVSGSMTQTGLAQVEADLATIFGQLTVAQDVTQATSRVGIVAFSSNSTVVANLTAYNDINSLMGGLFAVPYAGDDGVNLLAALQTAEDVIRTANAPPNRKSVILVYTSAYTKGGYKDPLPIANQIKELGITLITVAFMQVTQGSDVLKILQLASPGFGFQSNATNFVGDVQDAFCQVNCFCKSNWIQYTENYATGGRRFGECLRFADVDASWFAASFGCPAETTGAFLAEEFSAVKHKFNNDYARKMWTEQGLPKYFIGLSYDSSLQNYSWEQQKGQPKAPLLAKDFTSWDTAHGYPTTANSKTCVKVVTSSYFGKWQNENCYATPMRYICQVAACDTDNFCDSID